MVQGQKANYESTLIYKIVCNDLTIKSLYVGHTTNWIKRKYTHKYCCNNEKNKAYNYNVYKFIRDHGGWENWSMIEVFKFPCADKREAEAEERRHYEILNADLNSIRPMRTEIENKEEEKHHNKKNYQKHKEKYKNLVKIYQQKNKEKINQKRREYRRKNKEELNQKRRERSKKKKELLETVVVL